MTTRLKVGEYEAWLVVENAEVEHYKIEVDEQTQIATCWIASTAGKHFGVCVTQHHADFHCVADVYLDGLNASSRILYRLGRRPALLENMTTGQLSIRPFLFGVLHLTDDESALNTKSYEDLGNIKVMVQRVTDIKDSLPTTTVGRGLENDRIHERAKKSVTHRAMFGETQTIEQPLRTKNVTRQEIVATFIFRYRSLEMLRANEIAPHDATSVEESLIPEDVPSASLSAPSGSTSRKRKATVKEEEVLGIDSEDEEYRRKEAELEAELEKVRKARLDHGQGKRTKKQKVKHEQKPVFLPGEVIDLTI